MIRLASLILCGISLIACGGGGSGDNSAMEDDQIPVLPVEDTGEIDCSVESVNEWVYSAMQDYYLFYDQVPVVDPSEFSSPQQLLDVLRVDPPDRFSSVVDLTEVSPGVPTDNFNQTNFGLVVSRATLSNTGEEVLLVTRVYGGSPASEGSILRGDLITALNQVPVSELRNQQLFNLINGIDTEFLDLDLIQRADGERRTERLARATYALTAVPEHRVYELDNGIRVGFVEIQFFFGDVNERIRNVMADLDGRDIDELVIDLRSNPGGSLDSSITLISNIAGSDFSGQTAATLSFNDKYSDSDTRIAFRQTASSLNLPRLLVLTSQGTASASEIVVNSLRPYIDVVTLGDTTVGKYFGSIANERCDQRLSAMEVSISNAAGETYPGGLAPDCPIIDSFSGPSGSDRDSMMGAAVGYILNATCPAVAARSNLTTSAHTTQPLSEYPLTLKPR
ncbi:MAG: PDZ domain-containing protein [Gammaproteobacteria bacterium]|nr:PDZ domain-containing protein [Gammaproteobacteria bacterium]